MNFICFSCYFDFYGILIKRIRNMRMHTSKTVHKVRAILAYNVGPIHG